MQVIPLWVIFFVQFSTNSYEFNSKQAQEISLFLYDSCPLFCQGLTDIISPLKNVLICDGDHNIKPFVVIYKNLNHDKNVIFVGLTVAIVKLMPPQLNPAHFSFKNTFGLNFYDAGSTLHQNKLFCSVNFSGNLDFIQKIAHRCLNTCHCQFLTVQLATSKFYQ